MPIKPMFTVSGYRGIWGESLTEEIAIKYAHAFAKFLIEDQGKDNPTILIGRDGRQSGPTIRSAIIPVLLSAGINVVDGDILPTPTVLFSVRRHSYDGAIIITASHNPIEYNGLKFVNNQALFPAESDAKKINGYAESDTRVTKTQTAGILTQSTQFPCEHADEILKHVDVNLIRERKFTVAVDMINASACVMDPYLFEKLGVNLIPFNNTPNGQFAHKPEPNTENLTGISEYIKTEKPDLGFVHDPDADRLVTVNEHGEVVFEEYTIVLATENVLSQNPGGSVVVNMSTSQMSRDVAQAHGGVCYFAKVGEPNVVNEIIKQNAVIGGEGNGGVIYPAVNLARDSFVGIALILELLAKRGQALSECIATFPRYSMKKGKWPIKAGLEQIYEKLKESFPEATPTEGVDGIRLDFPNQTWLHLHPSNTEPIFRLYGEAPTESEINALFTKAELTFE